MLRSLVVIGVMLVLAGMWGGVTSDTDVMLAIPIGPIIMGVQALASILGKTAAGRAQGKQIEGQQRTDQDAIRARLYDTVTRNLMGQAGLGRDKAAFEVNAPSTRFDQAMRGGLAANMQDVTTNVPEHYARSKVTFSGGLRPSAIGPEGRQAGSQLAQLALSRMGQDSFDIPDMPSPPGLSGMPKSGFADKFLSVAGPIAAGIGALPELMPRAPTADYVRDAVGGIDERLFRPYNDDPRFPGRGPL